MVVEEKNTQLELFSKLFFRLLAEIVSQTANQSISCMYARLSNKKFKKYFKIKFYFLII